MAMEMSRRLFLCSTAAIAIAACSSDSKSQPVSSPGSNSATPVTEAEPAPTTDAAVALQGDPFTLGVASGDPDSTSVILWTRLAPDPLNNGAMPDTDVTVTWELASDENFATILASGQEVASPGHAHSVHAVATPPTPTNDPLYYRFRVGDYTSPVGLTRLSPTEGAQQTRFVSASCQNYEDGFYAAHHDIAAQKPDFIMWLGDYIYEGAGSPAGADGTVRNHGTPEPKTLAEYRNRYGLYKLDASLQQAHLACPWFVIWDDHEVENNYAGLIPQDPAETATFQKRRHDAYQAWWEHQPVRLDPPSATDITAEYKIYRAVTWSDLIGVALLDTRQYRSDQGCNDVTFNTDPACADLQDATRTLTGSEQEAWLFATIGQQGTTWNVIGQQIVMADITLPNGGVLNYDQWDGYPQARDRVLQHLLDNKVPNAIVLSGDIHLAGVAELRTDPQGPIAAVEFVDTSISSGALIDPGLVSLLQQFPQIVDAEIAHRGYILHTVTPTRWSAEYRIVADVLVADSSCSSFRTYVVDSGTSAVRIVE